MGLVGFGLGGRDRRFTPCGRVEVGGSEGESVTLDSFEVVASMESRFTGVVVEAILVLWKTVLDLRKRGSIS